MNTYLAPGKKEFDDIIADEWNIDKNLLYEKCRHREVCEARQAAMFIRVTYQHIRLKPAARMYNRDHATAIWAIKQVKALNLTDVHFRLKFDSVMKKIKPFINGHQVPVYELDNISMYQ